MIYQRQYSKILAAELLRYLLLGSLPNLNDISKRVGDALSKPGNITYKFIPQPSREIFQNEVYNKSLRKIKFDIDTFHEELLELFSQAASRLNYADLYHKINTYELNRLQTELEMLLFTVQDADFYFSGAYDTFSDLSKTDTTQSTKDVVDLSEECLALPYGGKNTKRIDVGSLVNTVSVPITVVVPGREDNIVISNNQIPSSLFGNIFTDTLSVWGHEVITSENAPLDLVFSFPLNGDRTAETEFFVSRIEVIPHSLGKQQILITVSNDDVNYLYLVGYEQGITTEDQKRTYAMDFETNLVQYVKVKISKTQADEEIVDGDQKRYRYLFGLKKFAAFQTGRLIKATYVSKPFEFNEDDTIGKVSIDADQSIPPGCSLDFSIATVSKAGETSSFIPITPIGTPSSIGASNVILFGSVQENSRRFCVSETGNDAAQVYGTPFQGKQFYRIGPSLSERPIFGKSVLFRGFKSWYRDTTGSFEIVTVNDNYVSFEQSDLEAMYALSTEAPSVTVLPTTENIRRVRLQVSRPPYYDSSRGHSLKPQPGTQNPLLDMRPNYAVYKVLHKASTAQRTAQFTLSSATTQFLPVANYVVSSANSADLPVLRLTTGQIFTPGVDYVLETQDIGGQTRPTGNLIIPSGSALLDASGNVINYLVQFLYKIDPDITHKVTRIDGTAITLDYSTNTASDPIEVVYRYIPTSPSQIIKSSIRVSNLPSTAGSRIFYVEGRDYVVDPGTGAIQRIPTGTINNQGSVYVQFSYRSSTTGIQTFTTWCFVNSTNGAQIKFDLDATTKKNKLVVDEDEGEAFYLNSKEGLINLTKATTTPIMPYGWVQFIVRSKSPMAFSAYGTNLIDQVIQLKDVNKKKVFRENNFYFNEITAFREPMVERTVNHLKVNTLMSDHTVFAIDSVTDPFKSYVVINFLPNTTDELYNRIPTEDSDETSPPDVSPEELVFQWTTKLENQDTPEKVIVKVDLSRTQDTDGAKTPKLFSFTLRVGS